jgi:hypothetical protein
MYMSELKNNRGWICALVAVTFAALAISGLMMLLHIKLSLDLKLAHIVTGIVFVAAGAAHLALNWKTFASHFTNRPAIITTVAAAAVIVALLFIGGPAGAGPHRNGQNPEELGIENTAPIVNEGEDVGLFDDARHGTGRGGHFGNGRWGDFGGNRRGNE